MGKETRFTRKNSQKQSCFLRSSCILFHKTWRSCFNGTSMQTVELKNTLQHDFRMNLFSVGLDGVNWQLTNSQDILNLQKKTSFNNDINWFWLINYASIISGVMKSLSEGSLHESVRHKLNSKGKQNSYSVLHPVRELLIQLWRHSLLSVLVVESDSINLLPKLLVKWSLGTRDCLKFNRQLTFTLGFTVKWQRTWSFFITLACVNSETHRAGYLNKV